MSDSVTNAAQGIIDIWITPSPADLRVLVHKDPNRVFYAILTVFSRIGAWALGAGLTGAGLWAFGRLDEDVLKNVAILIMGGLAGLVAFRLLFERIWQRRNRKILFERAQSVHVTGDGRELTIEDEHATSHIAYAGLDRPARAPTHLVLFKDDMLLLALPKAAFDKPETFDAFATFLNGLVAASEQNTPISEQIP